MINNKSSKEEIDTYFTAKIAEFMALVDEMEVLRQRDQSKGREIFLNEWKLYNPNTNRVVNVDIALGWMDNQIAGLNRRLEAQRNR